jgi:hypothetical protein
VLQEYVNVSPALGLYLTAGMAGLLVLIGATQWAWHVGVPETGELAAARPPAAALPAKPLLADDREAIREQVRGPGMGLIVSGVLGLVPIVLLCVAIPASTGLRLAGGANPTRLGAPRTVMSGELAALIPGAAVQDSGAGVIVAPPLASIGVWQPPVILAQVGPQRQIEAMPMWAGVFGVLIIGFLLLALPASILLILGGIKMRQLRSYSLAYLAAIVALLPLGPQWLISLPMGIWALAVLGRPEVKAAFE